MFIQMISFVDHVVNGEGEKESIDASFVLNEGAIYETVEEATSDFNTPIISPTCTDIRYFIAEVSMSHEVEINRKVTKLSEYN